MMVINCIDKASDLTALCTQREPSHLLVNSWCTRPGVGQNVFCAKIYSVPKICSAQWVIWVSLFSGQPKRFALKHGRGVQMLFRDQVTDHDFIDVMILVCATFDTNTWSLKIHWPKQWRTWDASTKKQFLGCQIAMNELYLRQECKRPCVFVSTCTYIILV